MSYADGGERGARADSSIAPEVVSEAVRVRAWVRGGGGVRAQAVVRVVLPYAALEKAGLALAMVGVRVRRWGWSPGWARERFSVSGASLHPAR